MWPTPTATPYGSSQNGVNGVGGEFERPSANKPSLENMARVRTETDWPTPVAADSVAGPREYDGKRGVGLNTKATNWPTPTTNPQAPNKNSNTVNGPTSLQDAALRAWPTPRATDNRGPGESAKRDGGPSLTTVAHNWPTPTATDAKASGAAGYSTDSGRHSGTTLTDAAVRQWATPAARDWKDGACEAANVPTKALLGRQAVRWATPQAHDANGAKTAEQIEAMKARAPTRPGGGPPGVSNLNEQATMWATPVASPNANRMTKAAPSHGNSHGHVLAGQAASWPTPVATLQSTAPSTTGAATLNGTAQAITSGLHDPTTSTDGEPTSPPEDPNPPSSRRRVLNPRFVEALMGLPPGWISVLPTRPLPNWKFSISGDPTSSASPETESSHNKPHSDSSISDDEPWEDEDDDAA